MLNNFNVLRFSFKYELYKRLKKWPNSVVQIKQDFIRYYAYHIVVYHNACLSL